MSNENQAVVKKVPITILGCLGTDRWKEEVKKALPDYLTPEMMIRIARSVASDPKFAACSPESFLLALIKCSRAGLVPDGRNAHLIPFGKEVQAIFDWKGMVTMAGRNGVQVTPKLVYSEDKFHVQEDDGNGNTRVTHEVDFTKYRGEIVLVYSRAKNLKGGDVDYEFMSAEEVEAVRQNFSRAKDSLMWTKSWGEAAKKTVIRRHSKRWDLSPEAQAALNEDDDALPSVVVAPQLARPIFQLPTAQSQPEIQPVIEPEVIKPEPTPEPEKSFLKEVRSLCKTAEIAEGKLLGFLTGIGIIDGSDDSLEMLAMSNPEALRKVKDDWADISRRIKEAK